MRIAANGIDIVGDVSGPSDAPAVLCLHSLATDADVWTRQLDALEAHRRVVRPDLRGHGRTSATAPPYTLDLLREDAVAVLDGLGIERVSVVGVSLGAIIALGLALEVPERVERIVVADCRADAPDQYKAIWDNAIATVETQGLEPVIDSSLERWFSPSFRRSHAREVEAVRTRALGTSVDGFIGCARAVQGLDYLHRLDQIDVPALFVVGSNDPAASPDVMRDMTRRVAGAALVELEGAGHLTPVEAADAFSAAVVSFLGSQ